MRKDAVLLRDANVNFVRTSHYPPTESFLDACDRHGIYVEEESAVCFVQQAMVGHRPAERSRTLQFTSRYMNQFTEMIERDRSHPCVIFWSLGNESAWGSNFQKEHDYAKRGGHHTADYFQLSRNRSRRARIATISSASTTPKWTGI